MTEYRGDFTGAQSFVVGVILSAVGKDAEKIRVLEMWDTDSVHYLYLKEGFSSPHIPLLGYYVPKGRIVIAGRQDPFTMIDTVLHELGHVLFGNSEAAAEEYRNYKLDELFSFLGSIFGSKA